jgi:hypothetical protein
MTSTDQRLFSLMRNIVPLHSVPEHDTWLTQIGFDSLSLVTLFVDIEQEFRLSLEAMSRELHGGCTFGGLRALCSAAQG